MPLYTYECDGCGEREERFRRAIGVVASWAHVACKDGWMRQVSVYQVAVSGFARAPVGERQVRFGPYNEASQEIAYQHSRRTNVDGSEAPTPPLWQTAKREAASLQKLGVKDSLDVR